MVYFVWVNLFEILSVGINWYLISLPWDFLFRGDNCELLFFVQLTKCVNIHKKYIVMHLLICITMNVEFSGLWVLKLSVEFAKKKLG